MTPYASFYLKVFKSSFLMTSSSWWQKGGGGGGVTMQGVYTKGAGRVQEKYSWVQGGYWWWRHRDTICIILLEGFQVFISNDVVFMVAEGWGGGGGLRCKVCTRRVQAGFRRSTVGYREDIGGGGIVTPYPSFYLKVFKSSYHF